MVSKNNKVSDESFRFLANALPNIVWVASADGCLTWYNKAWYQYTCSKRSLKGNESWESYIHADDLQSVRDAWNKSIQKSLSLK